MNLHFLFQDISTESDEVHYDPKDYMEKGETESSEKGVTTRSKAREKAEESMFGKVAGLIKRVVLGPDQKTEEEEKEADHDNDETEEAAEATFESIRDNRRPHEITVR